MLKTIKTTKQMRLDELIKYAFDNDVKDTRFESSNGSVIYFDEQGGFTLGEIFSVKKKSTFTVEVEVPIDENTRFSFLFEIDEDNFVHTVEDITISEMICSDTERIYAPLNCKLQLVWERDEE